MASCKRSRGLICAKLCVVIWYLHVTWMVLEYIIYYFFYLSCTTRFPMTYVWIGSNNEVLFLQPFERILMSSWTREFKWWSYCMLSFYYYHREQIFYLDLFWTEYKENYNQEMGQEWKRWLRVWSVKEWRMVV